MKNINEDIEDIGEWVAVVDHTDYEIYNQFPFPLRKTSRPNQLLKITLHHTGYNRYKLNGKDYNHHRLIALQFIANPNNLPQVDHIDRNKQNNHLENLRWVSLSENCKNKGSNMGVIYEFIDELPDDAVVVENYGEHQFSNLYYSHSLRKFIKYNGVQYRFLHNISVYNIDNYCVNVVDTENIKTAICLSKYQHLYGFI
jgi:hypothetical protein